MLLMPKCRRSRSLCAVLLALSLTAACARRVALGGSEANGQGNSRGLPFHGNADANDQADAAAHPGVPDQQDTSKAIPFRSSASLVLPVGTLLTVRLENAVTSAKPDVGKAFLAVVEEPVIIDGRAVVPRNAEVKGRVESARVSDMKRRTGYLRLALDSIRVGDKDVALPTSSLFARGSFDATDDDYAAAGSRARPVASRTQIIRLKKGRALTFRLIADVDLGGPTDYKAQSGTK
jgi:hypothetical protein